MNDQHHSEAHRQELSALMDGELSHDRARFALQSIAADAAVAAQWSRLHLLRHYLREAEVQTVPADFLAALQARLASEDARHNAQQDDDFANAYPASKNDAAATGNGFWSGWRQQAAGLAVAASVTMLALFGFNTLVLQPAEVLPTASNAVVADTASPATVADSSDQLPGFAPRANVLQDQFNATAIPVNYTQDSADFRQQINDYMLRHSQLASGSGRVGFAAYAPLLSSDMVMTSAELQQTPATQAADGGSPLPAGPMETPAVKR
ncbi:MAG: hypothetical protein Tsb0027_10870 [Wenzhouxiangellaceae bacterium]